jgi:hypothetical protein
MAVNRTGPWRASCSSRAVESELSDILRTVCAEMLALPCRCGAPLPHLSTHDIAEIDAGIRAMLAEVAGS